MSLLQGGGVSFGPNGVCWDCPLSFRDATELVAVVFVFICVALGLWLRQSDKPHLRTIGGCLFVFAAVEIFVINHAGWNWGVIQTIEPRQYYDRYVGRLTDPVLRASLWMARISSIIVSSVAAMS